MDNSIVEAHLRRCPGCRAFRADVDASLRCVPVDRGADSGHGQASHPARRRRRSCRALGRRPRRACRRRRRDHRDVGAESGRSRRAGAVAHDSRHLGAFMIAYAVALLVVVVRPARARTVVPVGDRLAGALTITAVIDLVNGNVPILGESQHLPEIVWSRSCGCSPGRRGRRDEFARPRPNCASCPAPSARRLTIDTNRRLDGAADGSRARRSPSRAACGLLADPRRGVRPCPAARDHAGKRPDGRDGAVGGGAAVQRVGVAGRRWCAGVRRTRPSRSSDAGHERRRGHGAAAFRAGRRHLHRHVRGHLRRHAPRHRRVDLLPTGAPSNDVVGAAAPSDDVAWGAASPIRRAVGDRLRRRADLLRPARRWSPATGPGRRRPSGRADDDDNADDLLVAVAARARRAAAARRGRTDLLAAVPDRQGGGSVAALRDDTFIGDVMRGPLGLSMPVTVVALIAVTFAIARAPSSCASRSPLAASSVHAGGPRPCGRAQRRDDRRRCRPPGRRGDLARWHRRPGDRVRRRLRIDRLAAVAAAASAGGRWWP